MLLKSLTPVLFQVWDHNTSNYIFVAGKSYRSIVFKNSNGDVLRRTVDMLHPLGKTVTEEEARILVMYSL